MQPVGLWLNHVVVAAAVLAIVQMAAFMWVYVAKIGPLKRDLAGTPVTLVAPPNGWTLAYHAAMTWILVFVVIGVLIRTAHEQPVTWAAAGVAAGCLAVGWFATRFVRFYLHVLTTAVDQEGPP